MLKYKVTYQVNDHEYTEEINAPSFNSLVNSLDSRYGADAVTVHRAILVKKLNEDSQMLID